MGAIIFRKREHLSERQRVVRTLKMMVLMGPIARVWAGSIRIQPTRQNKQEFPRRRALWGLQSIESDLWELKWIKNPACRDDMPVVALTNQLAQSGEHRDF